MTTIRIIPDPHRPTHRRRVILRDGRALVVHEHLRDHHGHPLWGGGVSVPRAMRFGPVQSAVSMTPAERRAAIDAGWGPLMRSMERTAPLPGLCATCHPSLKRPRAPGSVDCTECARLADESAAGAQTRQGE